MNRFSPALVTTLVCLLFAATTPSVLAQTPAPAPKVKKIPFHGKLAAVDTAAQTITLSGKSARVFHLTPTTRIIDGAGSPSSLSAAVVGEDVGGSYAKDATGTMTLFSVRFGAKTGSGKTAASAAPAAAAVVAPAPAPTPAAAPAPAPAATEPAPAATATESGKKSRFSGKIASIDAGGKSLVIHGETLMLTDASKVTDATGAAITLADLAVGDKISGSGMKSADGTVTVATLKKSR